MLGEVGEGLLGCKERGEVVETGKGMKIRKFRLFIC